MPVPHTLVCFHAHPDDEAIATGGTMAKAVAAGHRVVLVVATRGEHGEVAEGYLDPGEELWERRVAETHAAARILGVARVEFLGYVDSGMAGTAHNDDPASFWQADVGAAADRVAAILVEERADVLTVYDHNGVYGHPDHIQVHRVGVRAAATAGTPKVYMSTVDRGAIRQMMGEAAEVGTELPGDMDPGAFAAMGVPTEEITTRVDVGGYTHLKREAMAAHASQIPADSWFLSRTPEEFARIFNEEWYVLVGASAGASETDVFEGLG